MRGNEMEQEIGIQIKKEWQTLKAPAELMERTKKAAAVEEKRHRRAMRYSLGGGMALAAAAVIFLLIYPGRFGQEAPVGQTGTWLRLGNLTEGQEVYVEEELSMERVAVLPMAFMHSEEILTEGVTVRYAQDERGFWMAAFEDSGRYLVLSSQLTERAELESVIAKLLEAH